MKKDEKNTVHKLQVEVSLLNAFVQVMAESLDKAAQEKASASFRRIADACSEIWQEHGLKDDEVIEHAAVVRAQLEHALNGPSKNV